MLAGVGGCTVAQAKQHMSLFEFRRWAAYRAKRGSFNLGMRIEAGTGLLAMLYANTHSKQRYSRYDFMDHDDGPPIDLNKAMEDWA